MCMYTELMPQHTAVADWTQWKRLHFKERTVKKDIKLKTVTLNTLFTVSFAVSCWLFTHGYTADTQVPLAVPHMNTLSKKK